MSLAANHAGAQPALTPAPIMVATDLSEPAGHAARLAHALGARWGRPVVVAHIVEVGLESWWRSRYEVLEDPVRMEEALAEVADWYAAATGAPADRVVLRVDHCQTGLAHLVNQEQAVLLVMATSGKGAVMQAVVGSRVQEVASKPPCPLVVVPLKSCPLAAAPQVAVGIDFSPSSAHTLAFARALAEGLTGGLHLVHGLSAPESLALKGKVADEVAAVEAEATAALAEVCKDLPGVQRAITRGTGEAALAAYADAAHIDLLVVGSTGHRGVVSDLLGSTPRALIRHLTRPLVVVPPPAAAPPL